MLTRKQTGLFWIILILEFLLLSVFVCFRLIDYDEGLYLSYAQLVRDGNLPYLDFFHPQMPYLPYLYCMVSQYGFSSLFLGRLISASIGLLISIIFFYLVYRLTARAGLSLLLFFLYSFNGLTINWHSVVKTSAVSDLLALLSFLCFAFCLLRKDNRRPLMIFLSGLLVGAAFNFRLALFPILLVEGFLIFLLSTGRSTRSGLSDLALLLCGALFSSVFSIYLLARDPAAFYFGNVGYHLIWGNQAIGMTLMGKVLTLSKFVFYPQNLIILILMVMSAATLLRKARAGQLDLHDRVIAAALVFALVLIITFFLMSPTQFQYYQQALPYLLICSIPALGKLEPRLKAKKPQAIAVGAVYLSFILPFAIIFLFAVRQRDKPFEIKTVKTVVEAIQKNSQPDDSILTAWPAYAVLSERKVLPGLETWGGGVIPFLSLQQVRRFKLIDDLRVKKLIGGREVNLVVKEGWFPPQFDDLIEENYDLVTSTPFADIYVVKNHPTR
ncbi:MAG: hypothetical protein WBF13_01190 [Candidatus Zixiibacteriota bacterium]